MLFVDLLDAKGKIRNKVITGTGEEITVLAAHEEVLAVGTGNGLIRVLTVRGGKHLNRTGLPLPVRIDLVLTGHSSNVMTIDLQSGGHLISGGVDRSVRVWDLTSGALILSLTRRWPGWGPIYSIALLAAPLGTRCAIREETEVEAKDDVAIKRSASVTSIAPIIADDGTGNMSSHSSSMGRGNLSLVRRKRAVAVSSGDGGLRLWDMSSLIRHDGGSVLGVDGAGGSDSEGHGHRAYSVSSSRSRGDEGLGSQFSSCSRVLIEPGTNPLSGKDHPVVVTQLIEVDHTNLLATGDTKGIVCVWDEISWVKLLSVQVHPTAIASLSVRRIIGSVQQHSSDDLGSGLDEKGIRSRETAEDILAVLSNGVGGAQASVMNFFKLSL
jgi:WD40 repeat protein